MIYTATKEDIPFIELLENTLFNSHTRMSKKSILNSIKSPAQHVIMIANESEKVGALIYMDFSKSYRIYSLAIKKELQKKGYGRQLMDYMVSLADNNKKHILLEVSTENQALIDFYKSYSFTITEELKDYYASNNNAYKMRRKAIVTAHKVENLVVVEKSIPWLPTEMNLQVVSATQYVSGAEYAEFKGRVFNLCDSYKYQSLGYYVSLLAVARDHRVLPSITTINDFKNKTIVKSITDDICTLLQRELEGVIVDKFSIKIYFGLCKQKGFRKLAHELFLLFEFPFLEIEFERREEWGINKVLPITKNQIRVEDYPFVRQAASTYFSLKRFKTSQLKNYIYDLAILIDPKEETPPSDKKALRLFKKAAEEIGFYVEYISKKDYRRLTEFDALFIRETTNVNNHTYDFARYAYSEGLALIDDPWTILKCSNKVYLYERMKKHSIPMPKTDVITIHNRTSPIFKESLYPAILKQPDSAFSKGVFKVHDYEEFLEKSKELLHSSQLIIMQEYMESDYDWRIGILNNKVLFACKYFMAKGHWQIIDWTNNIEEEGDAQTFELQDVPSAILKTAMNAAALIGNGLYGVDLKEIKNQAYLIEVNDNPNIDSGIEDAVWGEGLYKHIVEVLFERIEMERHIIRYI